MKTRNRYSVTRNANAWVDLRTCQYVLGYEVRRNGKVINTLNTEAEAMRQIALFYRMEKQLGHAL